MENFILKDHCENQEQDGRALSVEGYITDLRNMRS